MVAVSTTSTQAARRIEYEVIISVIGCFSLFRVASSEQEARELVENALSEEGYIIDDYHLIGDDDCMVRLDFSLGVITTVLDRGDAEDGE
jgi:hypothetical protein